MSKLGRINDDVTCVFTGFESIHVINRKSYMYIESLFIPIIAVTTQ